MKLLASLVSLLLLGGCAVRPRSSIAVVMVPASIRGVPAEAVARARASLEAELSQRGQVVTRYYKDADTWVHAAYVPPVLYTLPGTVLEVRREKNPMKAPIPPHDTLMVRPKIGDEISGGPVPGFQ